MTQPPQDPNAPNEEPTRLPPDYLSKQRPEEGGTRPMPQQPPSPSYGQQPPPGPGQYGAPGQPGPPGQYGPPGPYGAAPYGAPSPHGPPYLPAAPDHPSAGTALTLGLVALIGGWVCAVPFLVGPFAWATGARVRREIDASGGRYGGRGQATAGMVMGIVATGLLALAVLREGLLDVLGRAGAFDSTGGTTYS